MVLISLHVVQGKRMLIKAGKIVDDDSTVDAPIADVLASLEEPLELGAVHVFADNKESPPGMEFGVEAFAKIKAKVRTASRSHCFPHH